MIPNKEIVKFTTRYYFKNLKGFLKLYFIAELLSNTKFNPLMLITLQDNIKIYLPVGDIKGVRGTIFDIFIKEEYSKFKDFLPSPGETVIDVGAYIGCYTLYCSLKMNNNGTLISIEPVPINAKILQKNLKINKIPENFCKIYNIALFDAEKDLNLYVPKIYKSRTSIFRQEYAKLQQKDHSYTLKIRAKSLDKFLKELAIETIDIMKVDVEGSEAFVLQGAKNTLKNGVISKLIIEVHKKHVNPLVIISILRNHDYLIRYFDLTESKGIVFAKAFKY